MNINDHNLISGGGLVIEDTFGQYTGVPSLLVQEIGTQWYGEPGNLSTVNSQFASYHVFQDVIWYKGLWVALIGNNIKSLIAQSGSPGTMAIATSPDYFNWTVRTLINPSNYSSHSLFINPTTGNLNVFIVNNIVNESSDGITYTNVTRSGAINCTLKPTLYRGKILSCNSVVSTINHLGLYDTVTNTETTYNLGIGNFTITSFATNGTGLVALFRTTDMTTTQLLYYSDLTTLVQQDTKFYIDGNLYSTKFMPILDVVWNGTYYILSTFCSAITDKIVSGAAIDPMAMAFFRSTDGINYHYCGKYDGVQNQNNNQVNTSSATVKYNLSLWHTSTIPILNKSSIASGSIVYFPAMLLTPTNIGTSAGVKLGVTWNMLFVSKTSSNATDQWISCLAAQPNTGEIVGCTVANSPMATTVSPFKSNPLAKQLRKPY